MADVYRNPRRALNYHQLLRTAFSKFHKLKKYVLVYTKSQNKLALNVDIRESVYDIKDRKKVK